MIAERDIRVRHEIAKLRLRAGSRQRVGEVEPRADIIGVEREHVAKALDRPRMFLAQDQGLAQHEYRRGTIFANSPVVRTAFQRPFEHRDGAFGIALPHVQYAEIVAGICVAGRSRSRRECRVRHLSRYFRFRREIGPRSAKCGSVMVMFWLTIIRMTCYGAAGAP